MEGLIEKVQEKILRKYYDLVYPKQLRENEYIKIHLSKMKESGGRIEFDQFVQGFDEYLEVIRKYRSNWNLYNELATVKENPEEEKLNGKERNLFHRQVLYLDFDWKDYPHLENDAYKYTEMIKEKLPDVFLHAVYSSGGGFHYYIAIEPTTKQRKVSALNKRIADLVGADTNACKVTQIARIPTTYNLKPQRMDKDKKYPLVLEITHYQNHPTQIYHFHPLNLDHLIRKVQKAEEKGKRDCPSEFPLQEWEYASENYDVQQYGCLCTEKVFREGADQGERNTWLGRIIVWFLRKKIPDFQIRRNCQEWNERCRPPKSRQEIDKDVDGWLVWIRQHGMSRIGGCWWSITEDSKVREIVRKQCDKFHCRQATDGYASLNMSEQVSIRMNGKLLTDGKLSAKGNYSMSGYEYLILTVLEKYMQKTEKKSLTVKELKTWLQNQQGGQWKLCMDLSVLKKTLTALVNHKCITLSAPVRKRRRRAVTYDDKVIRFTRTLKDMESKGYLEFYYSAARAMICHQITPRDYKVYLCILNNLRNHKSCTLESLDKTLNIGERNISGAIQNLEKASVLRVEQEYSQETGKRYNKYYPTDTSRWNLKTEIEIEGRAV